MTEGANADPGCGWPDALSASAVASSLGQPILLVTRDQLPGATADALTEQVNEVRRVFGSDRYATSRAMADEGLRRGLAPSSTWLAMGRALADGLVAGAAAGADRGLLLLVDGQRLQTSSASRSFLVDHPRAFDVVHLAGGTAAISAPSADAIAAILR